MTEVMNQSDIWFYRDGKKNPTKIINYSFFCVYVYYFICMDVCGL